MNIINHIKRELINQVTFGTKIIYKDFLLLYEPYSKLVPETIFATEVMNISFANYHSMKHGQNLTIMPFFSFNEQMIEEVRLEMSKKFANTRLDYLTFKEIYSCYSSIITEMDFAKKIFDINNSFYYTFKNGEYKAFVFKRDENVFLSHYDTLYDYFYKLYKNKKIDYNFFKELYKEYSLELSEDDFAACLGINYNTYRTIKRRKKVNGEGFQTQMFVIPKVQYSSVNITELSTKYRNKKIYYDEFKELYQQYGTLIEEEQFARIIGIRWGTFENCRNKKNLNMSIFKTAITEEEKSQILIECRKKGLSRKLIDYQYFCYLYEPYKEYISETDFANIIGIKQKSVYQIRYANTKALALDTDLSNKIIKLMREEAKELHNKYITYEDFQKLHSNYSQFLSETEYIVMLGISLAEYYCFKNDINEKTLVDYYKVERKIIKHQLSESRMYTLEEFNQLCKDVDIELDHLLILFFGEKKIDIANRYLNALKINGRLYIGDAPLSKSAEMEEIIDFCKNYAKAVCINLYCTEIMEDIASEALRYTLENCGSYQINFGDNWQDIYRPYMTGIMKMWCRIYKANQNLSLDKTYDNTKGKTKYDYMSAPEDQYDFINKITEDDIYSQILLAIQNGIEINIIIKKVAQKLNVDPKEVLKALKEQMMSKKLVKKDSKGNFMLNN